MSDRHRLPDERESLTHKFVIRSSDEKVGTVKGYITIGLFPDGKVGEIFVKMDKQGSQVSGFCDVWSIAVSLLLQHGVPLATICTKYRGFAFEPSGGTDHAEIRFARSPVDYVARYLELKYCPKTEPVA